MNDEILARVSASAPRRISGVLMLALIGILLIYIAMTTPPTAVWLVFLLVVGVAALWLSMRMWQATALSIELTEEALMCSDGTEIAKVADIEAVDRGVFAFKPSNGFIVRTAQPGLRMWRPGLWWSFGRRIGIGGVTPGSQTKMMSEILATMIAQRAMADQDNSDLF